MEKIKNLWMEYSILLVSLVATSGSLYYSEIVGFIPCELCWYQRILMYPIVAISLVGIIKKDREFWKYILPLSLIGMCVSAYHVYIQTFLSEEGVEACSGAVPCTVKYLNVFGFADIPFFCLIAFIIINALILTKIKFGKNNA